MTDLFDADQAREDLALLVASSKTGRVGLTLAVPCGTCDDILRIAITDKGKSDASDWVAFTTHGETALHHRSCARTRYRCSFCEAAPADTGVSIRWADGDDEGRSTVVCDDDVAQVRSRINKDQDANFTGENTIWEKASYGDIARVLLAAIKS